MAIQKISIENFTVFEKIEIDFCDGVNIFIGENGTGKTHLLKLLYTFCKTADSRHESCYKIGFTIILSRYFKLLEQWVSLIKINDEVVYGPQEMNEYGEPMGLELDSGIDTELYPKVDSVFIPAKEMLSMTNITRINDRYSKALDIDYTLIDIIHRAYEIEPDDTPLLARKIAPILENIIEGTVFFNTADLSFWVRKRSGKEIPFALEAEGFKKLGLLWQLLMNESITENSVLFWDEPEANLNPKMIPIIVNILLVLSKHGVQIFLATHDNNLAEYFNLKKKDDDKVVFHSLHKTASGIACESQDDYSLLEHNAIVEANIKLLEDDLEGAL